jgi:hypothetical protein
MEATARLNWVERGCLFSRHVAYEIHATEHSGRETFTFTLGPDGQDILAEITSAKLAHDPDGVYVTTVDRNNQYRRWYDGWLAEFACAQLLGCEKEFNTEVHVDSGYDLIPAKYPVGVKATSWSSIGTGLMFHNGDPRKVKANVSCYSRNQAQLVIWGVISGKRYGELVRKHEEYNNYLGVLQQETAPVSELVKLLTERGWRCHEITTSKKASACAQ